MLEDLSGIKQVLFSDTHPSGDHRRQCLAPGPGSFGTFRAGAQETDYLTVGFRVKPENLEITCNLLLLPDPQGFRQPKRQEIGDHIDVWRRNPSQRVQHQL